MKKLIEYAKKHQIMQYLKKHPDQWGEYSSYRGSVELDKMYCD